MNRINQLCVLPFWLSSNRCMFVFEGIKALGRKRERCRHKSDPHSAEWIFSNKDTSLITCCKHTPFVFCLINLKLDFMQFGCVACMVWQIPLSIEMGRMQTVNTWPLLVPSNWFQLVLVPVLSVGHNAGNQDKSSFRQTLQLLGAKLNQRMRKKKSHLPSSFTPPCSDEIVGKNAAGVFFSPHSFHKGLRFSQAKALNISVTMKIKSSFSFHPPPPLLWEHLISKTSSSYSLFRHSSNGVSATQEEFKYHNGDSALK